MNYSWKNNEVPVTWHNLEVCYDQQHDLVFDPNNQRQVTRFSDRISGGLFGPGTLNLLYAESKAATHAAHIRGKSRMFRT